MQKVKKLEPGGIYIFRRLINANSLEFESKKDVVTFFNYAENYLGRYMEIIEYALTPHGWEMMVKLKDKRTILKHIYLDSKSEYISEWSITKIIGERVRHFRSNFRRRLNIEQKRKGRGVQCCYEKFIFTSLTEAMQRINDLREGNVSLAQPEERFRGNKKYYDRNGKIRKDWRDGISLKTSKWIHKKGFECIQSVHEIKLKILNLLEIPQNVLHVLLKRTSRLHRCSFS